MHTWICMFSYLPSSRSTSDVAKCRRDVDKNINNRYGKSDNNNNNNNATTTTNNNINDNNNISSNTNNNNKPNIGTRANT